MLQDERHSRILGKLKKNGSVKVTVLARELNTSESTIRRDINELDSKGRLRKVFGGAIAIKGDIDSIERDVAQRNQIHVEEKEEIARYAASLISDRDFVYIDAGTTTERMIDYLDKKNVTYVTNGITHAKKLIQKGFGVYMVGGLLRPSTEAAIGSTAIDIIQKCNFTKCFMGTNGVDVERGFTTPDIGEAGVKSAVIKQSYETFVLADNSKFGTISSVSFADINEACIITDIPAEEKYCKATEIREAK